MRRPVPPPPPARGRVPPRSAAEVLSGDRLWTVVCGEAAHVLRELPSDTFHVIATSPPYWRQRDYHHPDQLGQESTPGEYAKSLCGVLGEALRTLRDDGTMWLNIGDSYLDGEIAMIPHLVATRLRKLGYQIRAEIIWAKPNPMPEPVQDRTTRAHEYVFLVTKTSAYFYDHLAILEPLSQVSLEMFGLEDRPDLRDPSIVKGANRRSVWTVRNVAYAGAHFAVFPGELPRLAIQAGTSRHGCCARCGTPYVRQVERVTDGPAQEWELDEASSRRDLGALRGEDGHLHWGDHHPSRNPARWMTAYRHLGWTRGCACDTETTVAALVLDPFVGSGTTVIEARHLGRRAVGVELHPDNVRLAEGRVRSECFLADFVIGGAAPPPGPPGPPTG